ncbi:MAG: acetoin dehydrogenase [Actinomycetota bacterium]|nr:acetoin dehydrogenase [Actinomycetota bacterium]
MSEVAAAVQELTYVRAVNEALRWALVEYPEALLFGEDVAVPGGIFGASRGLRKEFGERVFDMPISESAILGAAVGAAMRGRRPIVEIMFADFFFVALDQLVNQAANVRYVSRGGFTCPITVRSQQAAVPGACAQHAQSVEAVFAQCPGLRVGLPSNAQDAYEMLRAAIASDDPVIVLESRALYQTADPFTPDRPVESVGGARVVREGDDVTIVSWGRMLREAVTAAGVLAGRGLDAEVVDLRWLSPLDLESVFGSVAKTGRVVIAHEANLTGGFGGEIAARVAAECFWALDAPIERVATRDVRIPAAPALQRAVLPSAETIAAAAERAARG